jgi:hypothetical protein
VRVRELIDILKDQDPDAEVELSIVEPVDDNSDDISVDRYPIGGVYAPDIDDDGPVLWLIGGDDDDVDELLDALEDDQEA